MKYKTSALIICVILVAGVNYPRAQTPDEATRRLWDTAFINTAPKTAKRKKSSRSYRILTPRVPIAGVENDTVVGVTVWRLRHSSPADSGERILVHEGSDDVEWVPERVSSDSKLLAGDRVRVSIEAARTGYLYVIDRERYADGTLGEPYLIFPTSRTLNGDNSVKIGKLVEIPAQDDSPPFFTVKKSGPKHVGEVLSVFVTSTPIDTLQITDKPLKLSESQVASWEKQWSTSVGALELENGAGQTWTSEEKQAGSRGTSVLGANAPTPQVIYYRPQAKVSEPIMVTVRLRYDQRN